MMKKPLLKQIVWMFLASLTTYAVHGQMKIETGKTPEEIVSEFFAGDMVKIRNVRMKGNEGAIEAFSSKNGKPHFESGFIMSTGTAALAAGPNDKPKMSGLNSSPGDRTLDAISRNRTFDGVVLEFDFMAARDSVSLKFFFASEEYNEFVGNTFGDVFYIFVTGPDMGKGVHLARLETGEEISVNTVNANKNGRFFVNNNPYNLNGNRLESEEAKLDPEILKSFQFDGMTVPFERGLRVKPREVYHMKIAIADAGDGTIDSAVFFEGGSFSSTEQLWRVRRREEMERQRIADSIAAAEAYQDSIRIAKYIADSIRQVRFEDSLRQVLANQDSLNSMVASDSAKNPNDGGEPGTPTQGSLNPNLIKVEESFLIGFEAGDIGIPDSSRKQLRKLSYAWKMDNRMKIELLQWNPDQDVDLRMNSVRYYLEGLGVKPEAVKIKTDPPLQELPPSPGSGEGGSFIEVRVIR